MPSVWWYQRISKKFSCNLHTYSSVAAVDLVEHYYALSFRPMSMGTRFSTWIFISGFYTMLIESTELPMVMKTVRSNVPFSLDVSRLLAWAVLMGDSSLCGPMCHFHFAWRQSCGWILDKWLLCEGGKTAASDWCCTKFLLVYASLRECMQVHTSICKF